MALKMEEWEGMLNAVRPNNGSWLERIKEKLKDTDSNTYEEWEKNGFHIEHKFDVEYDGLKREFSLLCIAAVSDQAEVVKYLVNEKGAKVDGKDNDGFTPLCLAAINGHTDVIKALIENGAKVDGKDNDDSTPLHRAAFYGHTDAINVLIENGAKADKKDNDGFTPLNWAAFYGHTDAINVLIESGAKLDEKDKSGSTHLHWAAISGHTDAVNVLIENGAKVDEKRNDGYTPLHSATLNGHTDAIKALIENGAKVDEKGNDGFTPLHSTAFHGHTDAVNVLIENGAKVDEKDNYGYTPLHLAAQNGHTDAINVLIENGAKVDEKDNDGFTPLHLAVQNNRIDVAILIVNYIAKLEAAGLYVSEENLQKKNEFINTSNERHTNYLQHFQSYKEEAEKIEIEKENGPLYEFLKESNINNLVSIWERNEKVHSKFDNQETLQRKYPEYADILTNKANEVKKEIFLHNHKPLIDALSTHYGRDLQAMTFVGIKNFFEVHNDIMIKMVKYERNGNSPEASEKLEINKPLAKFVSFKDTKARHIPKLELHLVALQVVGNAPSRNLLNPNSEQHQAVGLLYS